MKIISVLFSVLIFASLLCAAATKYKPAAAQNTQNAAQAQQTQQTPAAEVNEQTENAEEIKTAEEIQIITQTPAAVNNPPKTAPAAKAEPVTKTNKAALPAQKAEDTAAAAKAPAGANKSNLTQKQVLAGFIAWDKKLKTLKADYKQETMFETTPITSSQGKIYKNGKNLRLDTMENETILQSAFTDKKEIQIRDGKGALITTLPWEEWYNNQPNKALFDFGNYSQIIKQHNINLFAEKENGYILSLYPRQINLAEDIPLEMQDIMQPKYQLTFLLDKKDFFPKEISISEEGVITKTTLSNVSKNINFTESDYK